MCFVVSRHTPLLPGNNESTCVTAFVRLAGTVISMAIVITKGFQMFIMLVIKCAPQQTYTTLDGNNEFICTCVTALKNTLSA